MDLSRDDDVFRYRNMREIICSDHKQVLILAPLTNAKAHQYGKALRGNSIVESIYINDGRSLTEEDNGNDLELFFDFIAQSPSLEKLELKSLHDYKVSNRFLMAATNSSSIRALLLCDLYMTVDCLSILMASLSIKKLALHGITLVTDPVKENTSHSTNAVLDELEIGTANALVLVELIDWFSNNAHQNVKALSLSPAHDDIVLIANGLAMDVSVSHSIQRFLQTSNTLESIKLKHFIMDTAFFEPIKMGILQSPSSSLSKLTIADGTFDREAAQSFTHMLHSSNFKVRNLHLGGPRATRFHSFSFSSFLTETLKSNMLTEIGLSDLNFRGRDQIDFTLFLQPLVDCDYDSTLMNHLDLGTLSNPREARELFVFLRKLRGLKQISFQVTDCCLYDTSVFYSMKSAAARALRRNCSLEVCNVTFQSYAMNSLHHPEIPEESSERFHQYCCRNRYIRQSIANPDETPIQRWPRMLQSALEYEYRQDIVFKSLVSMAGRTECISTKK